MAKVIGLFLFLLVLCNISKAEAVTPSVSGTVCLADIIFFETHGLPMRDKVLVGNVIVNRLVHPDFPGSICAIKNEPHQFPWVSIPRWKRVQMVTREIDEYTLSMYLAAEILKGNVADYSHGALFFRSFHAARSSDRFFNKLDFIFNTRYHRFYKIKGE